MSTVLCEVGESTLPVCLDDGNSNRLVSLWDILELFNAWGLYQALTRLETLAEEFKQKEAVYVIANDRENVHKSLNLVEEELKKAHFDDLAEIPARNRLTLSGCDNRKFYTTAGTLLHELFLNIDKAVMQRKFVLVLQKRAEYAGSDKPFGDDVHQAFPQAQYDIRQAAECFSVGANTATIFHLMRVAEHGLRALAYDRRIKVPKGPIDLATWEDIIKQLEKAELAIQNYPKTHAREAQYEFYHGAMMQLRSFKNVWRNRYSHTRGHFNEEDESHEAEKAIRQVPSFMQILASVFSICKRTPEIWKRDFRLRH